MEAEHTKRVEDVHALFQQLGTYSIWAKRILQNIVHFLYLLQTTLSGDDCADCVLNWSFFLLQLFNFFCDNRHVLCRRKAVYTVQEDCTVVVRDEIRVPRLEEFLFEVVYHLSWNHCRVLILSTLWQPNWGSSDCSSRRASFGRCHRGLVVFVHHKGFLRLRQNVSVPLPSFFILDHTSLSPNLIWIHSGIVVLPIC